MAFWDFSKKSTLSGIKVVILDFGSGSVKAIVTRLDLAKRVGYIVGFGKRHYPGNFSLHNLPEPELLADLTSKAIEDASKMAKTTVSECVLAFNNELMRGQLFNWEENREKIQDRIDEIEFQNILDRAVRNVKEQIQKRQSSGNEELPVFVDGSVQQIRIDGYHIVNPLGFKGQKINLKIFVFYISKKQKQYWDEVLRILKLENKGFVSSIAATIQAQVKHTITSFEGIFVDIGQQNTDLALVRDSILEGIKNVALGGRVLTEGISQIFDIGFDEAVKKKMSYELGELEETEVKKIESGLKKKVELLRQAVYVALKDFPETTRGLPAKIYLCGGGVRVGLVKKMFSQSAWLTGLPFTRRPVIEILLPTDVKDVIDTTETFIGPESVPASSAVRWLTRHYKITSRVEQILRRVLKFS